MIASFAIIVAVVFLLVSPAVAVLGFVHPPVVYYPIVMAIALGYLTVAQLAKDHLNRSLAEATDQGRTSAA